MMIICGNNTVIKMQYSTNYGIINNQHLISSISIKQLENKMSRACKKKLQKVSNLSTALLRAF